MTGYITADWYNTDMKYKHDDDHDSSAAESAESADRAGGKTAARYALGGALGMLLMVMLSELSGSAAPVGALLVMLMIFSLFDF